MGDHMGDHDTPKRKHSVKGKCHVDRGPAFSGGKSEVLDVPASNTLGNSIQSRVAWRLPWSAPYI
jgi:hypothetical protein